MISSKKIQGAYNNLYACLRNYIWPINAVEDIADLEISVYQTFPDVDRIKRNFSKLEYNSKPLYKDDEDLAKSADKFRTMLDECDSIYNTLDVRVEG